MTRTALFVRWVLGIVAGVFLLLGLAFMFIPATMIGAIDINAGSPKAMADIRAVYGGLDLALGVLLFVCFFRKDWTTGLAVGALSLTCMFTGRFVGIIWDPARDILTFGLFASEVLGAVLCAVALFLARQPEPAVMPVAQAEPAAHTAPAPESPVAPDSDTHS